MKIHKGDMVRVSSPSGAIETKVRLTQGIHPKVVAMSGQVGHWGLGRVSRAEKFVSQDPDTKLVWWKEHGNGNHPNAVIFPHLTISQPSLSPKINEKMTF
mgnify:CR=1 FL=1